MEEDDFEKQPIEERELLMKPSETRLSGFYPRQVQKLATKRKPRTILNIECNHFLRSGGTEAAHGHSPLQYRLWMEAGKHQPPFPERPDPNYNSNIWRNFRQQYGFHSSSEGQKVDEMIASMYPMNVPAPSSIKEYNYAKFLTETPLIKNEKLKKLAIEQTTKDILEFKRMRLRSESRNPPLDEQGHIMPPVTFKKHAHRFVPPDIETDSMAQPSIYQGETRIDMFGREVPKTKPKPPFLWKLSYKLNNPEYKKVKEEMKKKSMQPQAQSFSLTSINAR